MQRIWKAFHIFIKLTLFFSLIKSEKIAEEKLFKGGIFCRKENRLIRLERVGEIIVVEGTKGSDILLQCKFCDEEKPQEPRVWFRQNISSGLATEIDPSSNANGPSNLLVKQTARDSLIFHNLTESHSGLYLCRLLYEDDLDTSFNYIIDLTLFNPPFEEGNLDDWKNYSEKYIYPANNELHKLTFSLRDTSVEIKYQVFSSWTPWTECEPCINEPRRRRTGQCRMRPVCLRDICSQQMNISEKGMSLPELLLLTSTSLPCRGHLAEFYLPRVSELVKRIPDFVQHTPCEPYCPLRGGKNGPKERRNILLDEGRHLTVVCPGHEGDTKIVWRYNKRRLKSLETNLNGHVFVDHFGKLYLHDIIPKMKGIYACMLDDFKILEINLSVRRTSSIFGQAFKRHFLYLLFVIFICFICFCMVFVVRFLRQRRLLKRRSHPFGSGTNENDPLLWDDTHDLDEEDEDTKGEGSEYEVDDFEESVMEL